MVKINKHLHRNGFALPSVLISSIIMLTVLLAAVVSTAAVRVAITSQYYNQVAQAATDAGVAYAKSCLDLNNGTPLWTNAAPLKPNTDCTGTQLIGFTCPAGSVDTRCSVSISGNTRSNFSVGLPTLDINNKAVSISSSGTVELFRTSDGATWRTFTQPSQVQTIAPNITTSGLVLNLDAGDTKSYSGSGTAWTDLSGNNNSGSLMNGVGYSSIIVSSPPYDNVKALNFDGVSGYVDLGNNSSLNTGDNITIGTWVKPYSLSSPSAIYSTRGSNQAGALYMVMGPGSGGSNRVSITIPGTWLAETTDNAISLNTWQYVVYTKSGSTQKIYVNGVDKTGVINAGNIIDNTVHKYIGKQRLSGAIEALNGAMGNFQIYNRALSASEVSQNFNTYRSRYYNNEVNVLVVGGGGGGGSSAASGGGGGGGGAGGLVYAPYYPVILGQTLNVAVGNGGAPGGAGANQSGSNGGNSIFGSITAIGGGFGGTQGANGGSGGSGGGGGYNGYTTIRSGGNGTLGQGFAGGNTSLLSWAGGAGGGGAGGSGGDNKINHAGGDRGPGLAYSISGSSVTYSIGGGGGANSPVASPANTGKGGDAAYSTGTAYAGGSGIVIISYPTGSMTATGGTITTSGSYTIHTFTSSGVFVVGPLIQVYAWGAGGGGGSVGGWTYGAVGGAGAAAAGILGAQAGTKYNIVVGGGGSAIASSYNVGSLSCAIGGGACSAYNLTDMRYGGGGGGLSGIFSSISSQSTALLIAGGGGGGGSSVNGAVNVGGAGGGNSGQAGASPNGAAYAGLGGTQSAAGADASSDSPNTTGLQGALQGGRPKTYNYGGAGGGGYWGGSAGGYRGAGDMGGGGGGSGYYSSSFVASPVLNAGSGITPGDSGNSYRGTAGNAGAVAGAGSDGKVVIVYPTGTITATGGTITTAGGNTIHTFTANGFFSIGAPAASSTIAQVLVVAAGGGGGVAGGGGGGGVLYSSSLMLNSGSYPVAVGTGGTSGSGTINGGNGTNSSFSTKMVASGGGGGGKAYAVGVMGGSGGGGGVNNAPGDIWIGGASTAGQGYPGGTTTGLSGSPSGGGGGAGAVGANSIASSGGTGGAGLSYSISGVSVYYAGGGGGGGYSIAGGAGGVGGGGAGVKWLAGVPGTANTGGGGGGGVTGGVGGSGIVIISYPTGSILATGGKITTSGSNTIHTFTASGTFTVL